MLSAVARIHCPDSSIAVASSDAAHANRVDHAGVYNSNVVIRQPDLSTVDQVFLAGCHSCRLPKQT